jgi:hypothetical protein
MRRSGRLAVVVALSLELLVARAARADAVARAGAGQSDLARRTKPVRLELGYVWPDPPPPAPPAGSAATSSAPALSSSPPSPNASGAQDALAVLFTLMGDASGILVAVRTKSIAAGTIPMIVVPLGGAALVCSLSPPWRGGPSPPPRGGRCDTTVTGALIGTAVGLLPGILIYASAGSGSGSEDASNHSAQTQISGLLLALALYTVAVPVGTIVGYNLGTPAPPTPVITPPVATASLIMPVFALRF